MHSADTQYSRKAFALNPYCRLAFRQDLCLIINVNHDLEVTIHEAYIQSRRSEKSDVEKIIAFERELRRQEPDTYFREPDEAYAKKPEESFEDPRFNTAISFIALKGDRVIGRADACLISSRSDASCCSAYLDWICVLKSERHNKTAQGLLNAVRKECRKQGSDALIALMAGNPEAQSFYRRVEGASIHDTGIWISLTEAKTPEFTA